jgi:hypothetical protein
MYTLIRTLGASTAARRELIPGAAAFAIAELFYRFHSFALECLAFLATWYLLSLVYSLLYRAEKGTTAH